MWPKRYKLEIASAWQRVNAVASRTLETPWGRVEYAIVGSGQPGLMSHGVFGGHAEGLGMVRTYYGECAFAIAPSRFGYFASELPPHATPALQADVYATLLDALGIEKAVVIGFSAGGPSMIELALRHPHRVELLVLMSSALPRDPLPRLVTKVMPPLMRAAFSTDHMFWMFKTLMPRMFRHLIGVPKRYQASPAELATLREVGESVFPIRPRRDGAVFDTFLGNPYVNSCPLEEITPPTLVIHAADDALAPYETAAKAAARMPQARFVTIDRGGHELLGHEVAVRQAVADSLLATRRLAAV